MRTRITRAARTREGSSATSKNTFALREELLACVIARLIGGAKHVAVGAASPIPAAGALLHQQKNPALRVSMLHKRKGTRLPRLA